jgi:hypothetical protein
MSEVLRRPEEVCRVCKAAFRGGSSVARQRDAGSDEMPKQVRRHLPLL